MARNYKQEYANYHARPEQKKNRAARNLWNRRMRGKVPAGKEIDHRRPLMNGGSNSKSNIRLRDISANRADKSATKTAMWRAFSEELIKLAGEMNKAEIKRLQEMVRPGDIVSFRQHAADKTDLKDLLLTGGISAPISKVTGSPFSHTAMVDSIDPEKGIKLIENYEGSTSRGVGHRWLNDMADSTTFRVTRPKGYTAEEAQQAVEHARQAIGSSDYSKFDLFAMGPQEAARNILGEDSRTAKAVAAVTGAASNTKNVAQSCDPSTGVCSFLPVHSYGKVRGGSQEAVDNLVGPGTKFRGATTVSPARLAEAGELIGEVSPLNQNKSVLRQGAKLTGEAAMDAGTSAVSRASKKAKSVLGRLGKLRLRASLRGKVGL